MLIDNINISKDEFIQYLKDKNIPDEYFQLLKKFNTHDLHTDKINEWYDGNNTDVYNTLFFLIASFDCWAKYSRKFIKMLYNNDTTKDLINSCINCIDLGNGLGYSTKALKECFPSVSFYGTQYEPSEQYDYNMFLKNTIVELNKNIKVDCFLAFEYMEHIKEPIEHLQDLLTYNPKYLILANSFNTKAVGHYTEYKHNGNVIDQANISRLFNKTLRDNNYKKVETKFWNSRPTVWEKQFNPSL